MQLLGMLILGIVRHERFCVECRRDNRRVTHEVWLVEAMGARFVSVEPLMNMSSRSYVLKLAAATNGLTLDTRDIWTW